MDNEHDSSVKPVFKKSSAFDGSKKKYQKKVWKAAGKMQPGDEIDVGFFDKYDRKGIDAADIMTAMHYNCHMLEPQPHHLSRATGNTMQKGPGQF